jgi:hypothetical protein
VRNASITRPGDNPHQLGKCHRCGWTDELTKVDRHQRALLGAERHVRLLCDDCRAELAAATKASHPASPRPGSEKEAARGGAYRSVA